MYNYITKAGTGGLFKIVTPEEARLHRLKIAQLKEKARQDLKTKSLDQIREEYYKDISLSVSPSCGK